jgi:hypothetical protein
VSTFSSSKADLLSTRISHFFYANFIKADRLAKNAGTNVDQRERFYLKNLAPSAVKVRNIQSFGDG